MKSAHSTGTLILEYLHSLKSPVSATKIVDYFSQKNKTTIYRQLDRLEKEGLISSMVSGLNSHTLYEINHHHKVHFECITCGIVFCIEKYIIQQIDRGIITQIQLEGICQNCQKNTL